MLSDEIKETIYEIIESELDIKPSEIDPRKDISEQVDLDSMQFVALSSKIEEKLKIDLPISVMGAKTLNDFFEIIEEEIN